MSTKERAVNLDIPTSIETARLLILAVQVNEAAEVFEAVVESVNELKPWMPWVHPKPTLEGSVQFHRDAAAKWETRDLLDFQWREKSTGRLVGKGGFHTINWDVPKLEIGYWVRTSMAGKGYCQEAVNALVEFARTRLGAARLEICSDPRNKPSRRVAEGCGFTLEGILRKNMRDPTGGLRDSCMYAKVFE